MDTLSYVLLFQLACFTTYISFIVANYGILPSISHSWYELKQSQKSFFWMFTTLIGISMMMYQGSGFPFFFISGVGMTMVGTAAAFEDEVLINRIHYIGAIFGILGAFAGIIYQAGLIYPLYIAIVGSIAFYFIDRKNIIWWAEIWAVVGLLIGLYTMTG
jgi:hypothetical protein